MVRLLAQLTRCLDHVQDQLFGGKSSLAWDQSELRAERCHVIQLLLTKRIRADDVNAVTFHRAYQSKRGSCAAACILKDRVSGLQPAIFLGARNHGLCHPVFDAAGRILPLQLNENIRGTRWNHFTKSNDGCVPNCI